MIKKILREFYLLSRGDQRAFLLLSMLLIISLLVRITVQILPQRDPPGMETFLLKSRELMAGLAQADSLGLSSFPETEKTSSYLDPNRAGVAQKERTSQSRPIDINRADSAHLLPLPGIGPVFAGRIIKYRDLLGGYREIGQLSEVYGLAEETIGLIRSRCFFDTTAIKKIALDSASFRELLRHPYLQIEDVRALVRYRDFRGGFQSIEEIRDNRLLSDSTLQKVSSYLEF